MSDRGDGDFVSERIVRDIRRTAFLFAVVSAVCGLFAAFVGVFGAEPATAGLWVVVGVMFLLAAGFWFSARALQRYELRRFRP